MSLGNFGAALIRWAAPVLPHQRRRSQATYDNCVRTVHSNASDLTGAGALMLTGFVTNAAINGCPACGDPTGFVLEGDITTK
jgi:hypothetical protein